MKKTHGTSGPTNLVEAQYHAVVPGKHDFYFGPTMDGYRQEVGDVTGSRRKEISK